jgi:2-keto-4-pentenoate hydratase
MPPVDLKAEHRKAADCLLGAARDRIPCPPVRSLLSGSDLATGYAVQSLVVEDASEAGRRIVGRKVGLTSEAVQAQLGVDQPDFGVLFDDMAYRSGDIIPMSRLLQPRIEAEIAFILTEDLTGPVSIAEARAAVGLAVPALEIVDSRIAGWDISLVDTVADNASSGLYVLGDTPTDLGDLDLRDVEMIMTGEGGAVVSSGTGAACLGDPLAALVWLADTAERFGLPLRAGEVVLSGALGPMVTVRPGTSFTAELTGLGSVSAIFDSQEQH